MLQMCLRTAVLYFTVVLCLRLMGKRQVGELEPSELAVTFLVSEIATVPLQNPEVPLWWGILPVAVLMALEVGLSVLILKIVPLRELLCGRASRLMRRGHIDQRELRRQRMSVEELMASCGCLDIRTSEIWRRSYWNPAGRSRPSRKKAAVLKKADRVPFSSMVAGRTKRDSGRWG